MTKKNALAALLERIDGPRDLPEVPDWDSMYDQAVEELGDLPYLYEEDGDRDD